MFDEKNQEQVVEETLEASEMQNVEKASADEASTTTADNVAEIADYLNPELFNDIKTLSDSDLDENLPKQSSIISKLISLKVRFSDKDFFISLICNGVVPQQPPIILAPKSLA